MALLLATIGLASCERSTPNDMARRQSSPSSSSAQAVNETAAWWLEQYSAIPESDPRRVRAQAVFDRVQAASERRSNRIPQLVLLDTDGSPMAMALRDGKILLTRGAIDFCYQGQLEADGDSRLAFVLGHELAHLAENHFGHALAFSAVARSDQQDGRWQRLLALLRPTSEDRARIELDADRAGILSMTFAGYLPWAVLSEQHPFIEGWVERGAGPGRTFAGDASHPSPRDRAAYLRSQLKDVADSVPLFHFGTRLLEVGRIEDGLLLLGRFGESFPGREVLSNLGVGHARLALRALGRCDGALVSRFRLPLLLDESTLAERTIRRGASSPCFEREDVRRESVRAISYLEAAAASDPSYAPAQVNLIAAFVLFDQPSRAVAQAKTATDQFPEDLDVDTAAAVALYAYGERSGIDTADRALEQLERVLESDPRHPAALFDRAAILQERGRAAAAESAWRLFLATEPNGTWAETAHAWLGEPVGAPAARLAADRALPSVYTRAGRLGRGELPEAAASASRQGAFDIGDLRVETMEGRFLSLLRLGGSIELIEAPLSPEELAELRTVLGAPRDIQRTPRGEIRIFADCAIEVDQDGEATLIRFAPTAAPVSGTSAPAPLPPAPR